MASEIIRIEDVYTKALERMLDDESILNLIDDDTSVGGVLSKVMGILALYHRNTRMMEQLQPEYVRRLRFVERLFRAYQDGVEE
ncbi:MAG TPA: hypothetical protein HA362_03380 [Nanoarchaeota archaeon]|nr:hypothetical protein [Nanoarchaeota archaeon]